MQALKAAVIIMGLLILAAFGLVVYSLMGRLSGEGAGAGFGAVDLVIPAGCGIAAAEPDGERLVIRLEGLAERGCQQVLVLDLASGRELGRIGFGAKP